MRNLALGLAALVVVGLATSTARAAVPATTTGPDGHVQLVARWGPGPYRYYRPYAVRPWVYPAPRAVVPYVPAPYPAYRYHYGYPYYGYPYGWGGGFRYYGPGGGVSVYW